MLGLENLGPGEVSVEGKGLLVLTLAISSDGLVPPLYPEPVLDVLDRVKVLVLADLLS